ncbi:MAG: 16S rRNA (uracil(1498)-N(3))-methyltransferase [Deltaproteobacteria bacterium]|nr:16S rRNA (uracil(1498)-N(3))-methyltransferase [Deltaproteobacteria bacterium]
MPIFIIKNNPGLQNPIVFSEDDLRHIKKSLRVKLGEELLVTDNQGALAAFKVTALDPLCGELGAVKTQVAPKDLTVCLPLIEQKNLEWAVQKLTELNVAKVQLLSTERTQKNILSSAKWERLLSVAENAQKQCLRAYPLQLQPVKALQEIKFSDFDFCVAGFIADHSQELPRDLGQHQKIAVLVGPEGGFTDSEMSYLLEQGVVATNLGLTVLRSETAAIVLADRVLLH